MKMQDENALMAALQSTLVKRDLFDEQLSAVPKGACAHVVNGVNLLADPDGVLFWPDTKTLIVADLHLEKGSSIAMRGQMLPPYDTITTLRRLQKRLDEWRPERVIALGDSFHDVDASSRLPMPALEALKGAMQDREWIWITGNHDPEPPIGLGGTVINEVREGGLIFRHEPQIDDATGEIAGHLHPKARIIRRGRAVRRSCFAASDTRMILPSFGAYTGGLSVLHRAYEGLFEARNYHALMRGDGQVYKIPASELR